MTNNTFRSDSPFQDFSALRVPTFSSQDYSGTFRSVSQDHHITTSSDVHSTLYAVRTRNITATQVAAEFNPINFEKRVLADSPLQKCVPVGVFMDNTASMGQVPESSLAQEHISRLMGLGLDGARRKFEENPAEGYKELCVLLGVVGDIRVDSDGYLQMADFNHANKEESSEQIITDLKKIFLKGGGGGNQSESYPLVWEAFAQKVDTQLCEAKPIVFTIGDDSYPKPGNQDQSEPAFPGYLQQFNDLPAASASLPRVPENITKQELGRLRLESDSDLTTEEMKQHAENSGVELYHISVAEGATYKASVKEDWDTLLGESHHFVTPDYRVIFDIIAVTVLERRYGFDRSEALGLVENWWEVNVQEENKSAEPDNAKNDNGANGPDVNPQAERDSYDDFLQLMGMNVAPAEADAPVSAEERKADLEKRMETLRNVLDHKEEVTSRVGDKRPYDYVLPFARIRPRVAPHPLPTSLTLPTDRLTSADQSVLSTSSDYQDTSGLFPLPAPKRYRPDIFQSQDRSSTGISGNFRNLMVPHQESLQESDSDSENETGVARTSRVRTQDFTLGSFSLIEPPTLGGSDDWSFLQADPTYPGQSHSESSEEDRKMPASESPTK